MTSYLEVATYRHIGVTVALYTDVGSCQTVAFPIDLLTKAQSTDLFTIRSYILKNVIGM